jgi:hypothetical protein
MVQINIVKLLVVNEELKTLVNLESLKGIWQLNKMLFTFSFERVYVLHSIEQKDFYLCIQFTN